MSTTTKRKKHALPRPGKKATFQQAHGETLAQFPKTLAKLAR